MQEPVTVLLKEYLPGARSVACNEMQALVHLAGGLPDRKWHAAIAPVLGDLPIVPLLGKNCYSHTSFQYTWLSPRTVRCHSVYVGSPSVLCRQALSGLIHGDNAQMCAFLQATLWQAKVKLVQQ